MLQSVKVSPEYSGELTGWLTPTGSLYPCEEYEHSVTLYHILHSTDAEASDNGWVHVGVEGSVYKPDCTHKLTYAQDKAVDTILEHPRCSERLRQAIYRFLEERTTCNQQ